MGMARKLNGMTQVVLYRNNGESTWMDFADAKRVAATVPSEWKKEPFGGQTYGTPVDPWTSQSKLQNAATIAVDPSTLW
ncbi:hypothetical protein [Rhizobium mongolense]